MKKPWRYLRNTERSSENVSGIYLDWDEQIMRLADCEEGSARSAHFGVSGSARVTGYSFPNLVMEEWQLRS